MKKLLCAAALSVLVTACATSTPYVPASSPTGFGFSEQRIEEDRYRVMFRGNSSTTREAVETFLLYRAAELTVMAGYDYFIVVSEDTEEERRYYGPDPRFYAFYGRGRPFPYYGYGYRWGPGFYDDRIYDETVRYTAMAFFTMARGEKPEGDFAAYDARSVLDNLGPSIVGPRVEGQPG